MNAPFRLDQHPRRAVPPLSGPPAGYFEQLPVRVMAQVAVPARRPLLPAWLLQAPLYLRTGIASTLLLGTFAASLWLGGGPAALPASPASASLDTIPKAVLVDYLTSGETRLDIFDLASLPPRHQGITKQYLHPSAGELTAALDEQPTEDATLL